MWKEAIFMLIVSLLIVFFIDIAISQGEMVEENMIVSEIYTSNKSSIIITKQSYIDTYFDWRFTEINETQWKANFTVDKDFWNNVTYCRGLNKSIEKATCFLDVCNDYLSDYLDCSSPGNGTKLLNDITNFISYPLKNLTSNIQFSNIIINPTEGKASFDIIFPEGFKVGERADFGFGTTSIWTTNSIITFDDDDGEPAFYIANITNGNKIVPNFIGNLTKFAVQVTITVGTGIDAGEGTEFWHCETNTCADVYYLGALTGTTYNTEAVYWVNVTNSALLSRIEHNGIDAEFLKANETADVLDGGENLNYVASVILEYTPPPSFSSPLINDSDIFEGERVNHSITISNTPDGYIFSWNASGVNCNTWVNSSWVDVTTTNSIIGQNISTIPTGCAGNKIGWRFHSNNTIGWTASNISTYSVSKYGMLQVNITSPLNNTNVTANTTFYLNATIICTNGASAKCGIVNALARYNKTSNPDTAINTTNGGNPLYIITGNAINTTIDYKGVTQANDWHNATSTADANICSDDTSGYCTATQTELSDAAYSDTTSISNPNDAGPGITTGATTYGMFNFHINTTRNITITNIGNITFRIRSRVGNAFTHTFYVFDNNANSWESLVSQTATSFTTMEAARNDVTSTLDNYVDNKGYMHLLLECGTPNVNLFLDYINVTFTSKVIENPQTSPSTLLNGQSFNVSWTINATGNNNTHYLVDVNFNSSYTNTNVPDNDTEDRRICIGNCPSGPVVDIIPPTVTLNSPDTGYFNDTLAWTYFNCTASDTSGVINISLWLTNSSNASFSFNLTNTSSETLNTMNATYNLSIGNYTWNCYSCDDSTNKNCGFATSNRTVEMRPLYVDTTPPSFSNNQTNASSTTYNGTTVQINLTITDNSNINFYRLTHNDTSNGVWINETLIDTSGSSVTPIFNYTIRNFTTSGGTMGWRVWANDTAGNVNVSNIYTFQVYENFNISSCRTLNTAGETYYLNANIINSGANTCMNISANNIVLDCQGYTIDGIDGSNTQGIWINRLIEQNGNIRIKNCNISDWQVGIYSSNAGNVTIANNSVSSCTEVGIELTGNVQSNYVYNNTIFSNVYNIYLGGISNVEIYNNKIINGSSAAFQFYNAGAYGLNYIWNNLINSSNLLYIADATYDNSWNTTLQTGTRIYSSGTQIGGNYWTNSSGDGYSDICTDSNANGFCDTPFNVTSGLIANGNGENVDYLPYSDEYCIDCIPPSYSLNSTNASSTTYNGTTVQINLTITDSGGIDFYRLTINDTQDNTFGNKTIYDGNDATSVTAIFNYTIMNISISGGTLGWKVWANDTLGNSNVSNIYTFVVQVSIITCDCPTSGNWVINDGSICTLSTTCNINTNKLRINNGGLLIQSSGYLRTGGCYVADAQRLYIDQNGGLYCGI